jgi:assimilatory nitrate reductase catalytic subunit
MTFQQTQIIESTCAYCGVGCGVDITKQNNNATHLQGSASHPANFGKLCIKGQNLLSTNELSSRLLVPEVDGKQVSWQAAIKQVADQFSETIAKYGKNSVAFYVSGQLLTEDYYLANKLMKGYIGSGNIDTNSRLCMSSAVAAYKRSFGEDVVPCNYQDLEVTQLLLITGSNAAWTHPVLYQRIERAKKINPQLKVVVIDPRKTATSELSDFFLPIKPGTDAAFFNGLLNFLSKNGGLDERFIKEHTDNFTLALAEAKSWSIENVASYCQLDSKMLKQVYQLFCQSESAVTFYSMGINQSSSGVDKCQSIINCHLASGKIAKAGCGPFSITGQPNAMGGREVGGLANQLTAHLDIENAQHRDYVQSYWQSPTIAEAQGKQAVDMFDAIDRGEIKAVWIMATNPLVSLPERDKIARALGKCPLVVVSDCVAENDTMAFANIKLPATPWLEKNGTVTNSERRISRQRSVLSPAGDAKHDWQIIADVAKAMGFSGFDYHNVSEVFTEFAKLTQFNQDSTRVFDISGLADLTPQTYDQLRPMQWPINTRYPHGCDRVYQDSKFSTENGKAKFYPITPALPKQSISNEFSLMLNSGRLRDHWHSMTRTGTSSVLTQHTEQPFLYLHTSDLNKFALTEGELVSLTSHVSNNTATEPVIVQTKIDDNLRAGECFMPIHWNKQFASHANVSCLYPSVVDPLSGQPESKQVAIAVAKTDFQQFVQCFVRTGEAGERLANVTKSQQDFWLKNKTQYGRQYRMAYKKTQHDPLNWCQQQLKSINEGGQSQGEWLSFGDESSRCIVYLEQKQLVFIGYFSTQWSQVKNTWLDHVFSKEKLDFSDIQALLLGQASAEFSVGKQVCSCFNIAENRIVEAINQGCNSVEQLGVSLKCGTNCGSCKPELAQLIKLHKNKPYKRLSPVQVSETQHY